MKRLTKQIFLPKQSAGEPVMSWSFIDSKPRYGVIEMIVMNAVGSCLVLLTVDRTYKLTPTQTVVQRWYGFSLFSDTAK